MTVQLLQIPGVDPSRVVDGNLQRCDVTAYKYATNTEYIPSITFIRHPISYYETVWNHLILNKHKPLNRWYDWSPFDAAAKWMKTSGTSYSSFSDWVYLMIRKEPLWYTRLLEHYIGPAGGEWIDWIGRMEYVAEHMVEGLETFGEFGKSSYGFNHSRAIIRLRSLTILEFEPVDWSTDIKAELLENERLVIDRYYGPKTSERKAYASLATKLATQVVS